MYFFNALKYYNVKINLNSSCVITLFSHKFAKITYNKVIFAETTYINEL